MLGSDDGPVYVLPGSAEHGAGGLLMPAVVHVDRPTAPVKVEPPDPRHLGVREVLDAIARLGIARDPRSPGGPGHRGRFVVRRHGRHVPVSDYEAITAARRVLRRAAR